jgi:CRISPR/Cas system Type II protein with McrA/HNH and RuvC-like nuclease domain
MRKRKLNDAEKQQVIEAQRESDGSLRCFISGEVINLQTDDIEFDHLEPYSKGGDTSVSNIRVVLKTYNRRKSDQSLYEVRDNLRLERLFIEKKNSIKLQDILVWRLRNPLNKLCHSEPQAKNL